MLMLVGGGQTDFWLLTSN